MHSSAQSNSGPGFAKHPAYRIELQTSGDSREAILNGTLLAKSTRAIVMHENKYPPVIYFPRADVRLELLSKSEHSSYCPFKGTASYWHFGGEDNIAWSYETPYDEMAAIKGYIAFYKDRLDRQP